jgi:hypothetical protein
MADLNKSYKKDRKKPESKIGPSITKNYSQGNKPREISL